MIDPRHIGHSGSVDCKMKVKLFELTKKCETDGKWSFPKVSLFIFRNHKFLKTSTNADTSDIKMVQFVDFSLNNANRNNLLAQIPQLALQIIGADSHL